MEKLTQQRLHELLMYDANTGDFFWKISINSRAPIGSKAGKNSLSGPNVKKYRMIGIDGVLYKAHSLVWFYFNGTWPTKVIDHINGDTLDNRIENLRDVSHQQNSWNLQKAKCNSKSGYLGVDWKPDRKKWRAQIRINGAKKLLGYFDAVEDASAAYQDAKNLRWRP